MEKNALNGLTAQFGNATMLGVAGTTINLSVATTFSIRIKWSRMLAPITKLEIPRRCLMARLMLSLKLEFAGANGKSSANIEAFDRI